MPTSFAIELKPFARVTQMTSRGHVDLSFDSGQPYESMFSLLFKYLSKGRSHRTPFLRAIQLENYFIEAKCPLPVKNSLYIDVIRMGGIILIENVF